MNYVKKKVWKIPDNKQADRRNHEYTGIVNTAKLIPNDFICYDKFEVV